MVRREGVAERFIFDSELRHERAEAAIFALEASSFLRLGAPNFAVEKSPTQERRGRHAQAACQDIFFGATLQRLDCFDSVDLGETFSRHPSPFSLFWFRN
jgi:hypothetical protein